MSRILSGSCAAALLLAAVVPGRADDEAEMRALVARAIQAHGGAENLAKYNAVVATMLGKTYPTGEGLEFRAEQSLQFPDRLRSEIDITVAGKEYHIIQVLNGDKGWVAANGKTVDLPKAVIAEMRQQLNSGKIARLEPLRNKEYKLSPLGAAKVGEREAVGVHVEHKDLRDTNLFFDKKTGMLLKSETRAKDLQSDQEVTMETFYDNYKKVEDVQVAHKITIKRDGKLYLEGEISEVKLSKKLDDDLFARPK